MDEFLTTNSLGYQTNHLKNTDHEKIIICFGHADFYASWSTT